METIEQTVQMFLNEMHRVGYGTDRLSTAASVLERLCAYHSAVNRLHLDRKLTEKYVDALREKLNGDPSGQRYAQREILNIRIFLGFVDTGKIIDTRYTLPRIPVPDEFSEVIDKYVDETAITPSQKKSRSWAPRRYAFWLSQHGVTSFHGVSIANLRAYIIDENANLKSKTIPSLRVEMRKFHIWLHNNGYIDSTYEELFDFQAAIKNKIHPAAPPDDVAKAITQIDRSTALGKRDYAAIMLGVVLGLRGCDVRALHLTDINWREGEIRISQSKTGKPLALPLTCDVGEALRDYILNGRPHFDDPHVFLRHKAPVGPIKSGGTFGEAYTKYMKLAGLDGPGGFYQLRRAEGKNLVVSGTPVTVVAQILGHTDITNTKQYIALDTGSLKNCALSFDGIEPRGWKS